MIRQQFYVLTFANYETESFNSLKPYFGSIDDIADYIDMYRKTEQHLRDKIKISDFVYYHKGVARVLTDRSWLFKNGNSTYDIHADRIELQQIAVRYDGYYHRCMKAKFCNLTVEEEYNTEKYIPVNVLSGNPSAFITNFSDESNRIIESRFFVSEDSYDTLREAKEHMAEQYISFDSLMEDIFGEN